MTDSSYMKWQITIFSAFIFVLVSIPCTYKLTQQILGGIICQIADSNGCPTTCGLALHTLVYVLLIRGSMELNMFKEGN